MRADINYYCSHIPTYSIKSVAYCKVWNDSLDAIFKKDVDRDILTYVGGVIFFFDITREDILGRDTTKYKNISNTFTSLLTN